MGILGVLGTDLEGRNARRAERGRLAQLLGRLPWFAELFLRAFFLRDFLAMVGLLFVACFPQRW